MQTVLKLLRAVLSRLAEFFRELFGCRRPSLAIYQVINNQLILIGDATMFLTSNQEMDLAVKPLDVKGNPAQVDGVPVWESSAPDVIEIVPKPDGLSATAKAKGIIGAARITVSADADLTNGVKHISGYLDINVVAGEAVTIEIIAGEIREQ